MVEFKAKPVPTALILLLLLAAIFRLWQKDNPVMIVSQDQDLSDGKGGNKNYTTINKAGKKGTGESILEFFEISEKDGLRITWSHGTNSKMKLETSLKDDTILMIEADIRMKEEIPVLAHDVSDASSSDITLREWLNEFKQITNKGIKLDIKTSDALHPSLSFLKELKPDLHVPVLLNSDILQGPNGASSAFKPAEFFEAIEHIFSEVTLSIGWTTDYKQDGDNPSYTAEMIDEMLLYCKQRTQPITFPVRASLVKNSLPELRRLLTNVPRSSLTVWHYPSDHLDVEDLLDLRNTFPKEQVFYDVPYDVVKQLEAA